MLVAHVYDLHGHLHSRILCTSPLCFLLHSFLPLFSTKKLFQLDRIYLDGQSLSSIDDCFDVMSHTLTHIYLQRNALTSTQGFASLRQLRFLTLAHNRIRTLEGLAGLAALQFLDVSHNLIELLDTGDADSDEDTCQLPESLVVFNCRGNPFTESADYKEHIATVSPYLKTMDGERITNRMRREWGLEASDDDEEDDAAIAAAEAAAAARARAARKDGGDEDAEEDEEELSQFILARPAHPLFIAFLVAVVGSMASYASQMPLSRLRSKMGSARRGAWEHNRSLLRNACHDFNSLFVCHLS